MQPHQVPPDFELLFTALHGLKERMLTEEMLAALSGGGIEAPEMKKRGRLRKRE